MTSRQTDKTKRKQDKDRDINRQTAALALAGVAVGAAALGAWLGGRRRSSSGTSAEIGAIGQPAAASSFSGAAQQPASGVEASESSPALFAGDAIGAGEHVPTDLMSDEHPDGSTRAEPAFRPDMGAPMSAAEREALRPATIGAPPRDEV